MPVNVLFCVDTVGPDAGTEAWVTELVRRLDRSAFTPHLCCLQDSPRLQDISRSCPTAVFPVTALLTPNGARQALRLRRYAHERRIDVIHTFMVKSALFGIGGAAPGRVIIGSRRNLGDADTERVLPLLRCANRIATRILANSEAVREAAVRIEGAPPEKVDVIHNGVDLETYAPGPPDPALAASIGLPPGAPVVGMVANFRAVKRHTLFLEAARIVAEASPNCTFLLVGEGPLQPELEQMAATLSIRDRVCFVKGEKERIPKLLNLLSVACLTSEKEGFSNALLEYMASGLPVVATDAGGNREAVEHERTGFLAKDSDPANFAGPVLALLRDPALRARMGSAGLERCRTQFDIRDAVRRHERYYVDLLAQHRRPAM